MGPKKCWVQKNLSQKNVMPQKNFGQVLAEIFHYTETLTNVAGTNVAWSNVPETVANAYRQPNQQVCSLTDRAKGS